MKCVHCNQEIDIENALEKSEFSWPLRQVIWYACTDCGQGNHIRFEDGKVSMIKMLGSPGYDYDICEEIMLPDLKVRVDPSYLHVWVNGKHHEVKERD